MALKPGLEGWVGFHLEGMDGKAFQMMEQHGIGDVRRKYQAWGRAANS